MAVSAFLTPKIEINGIDMSGNVFECSLEETFDTHETTAFGDTAKKYVAGLSDATVSLSFRQDFAIGSVNYLLKGMRGLPVSVKIRATNSTISTSNPEYQFTAIVAEHKPFDGEVGSPIDVQVTWQISGAITVAYA